MKTTRRACVFCGKSAAAGRRYARRGMLKKKGGVGRRTMRVSHRRFRPNLQRVRILLDGTVARVLVCTACLKSGRALRPPVARATS